MHFLAAIFLAIGSLFGHSGTTPPSQPAAVVEATQQNSNLSSGSVPTQPVATTTIVNNITNPIIERIIEKQGFVLGTSTLDTVTHKELADAIAAAKNQFLYSFSGSPENTPVSFAVFSNSQKIDKLDGVTITNSTLDATSIPDLSSTYLNISSGMNATRASLGLAYATSSDINDSTNIAAWGDSLTAGNEDGTGGTYPKSLQSIAGTAVYNGGVGGETSTQIKTRMLAATEKYSWPTIIWVGRNNFSDPVTVKADIAAMVAALASVGNSNYLVLGVLNGNYVGESSGQSSYNTIVQLNADLAATYGTHFIDIRAYLISLYDSNNTQDVIDHNNDVPPSSLRYDNIHLTAQGYADVAQRINQDIDELQPNKKNLLTTGDLPAIFASPSDIGSTIQNAGYFSILGIATTTPLEKVGIKGNLGLTGANSQINTRNGNTATTLNFDFPEVSTQSPTVRFFRNTNTTATTIGLQLFKGDNSTSLNTFLSANTQNSYLNALGGNIGIGTSTPLERLGIKGDIGLTSANAQINLRNGNAPSTLNFDFPELSTQTGDVRLFRNTNTSLSPTLIIFEADGAFHMQSQLSSKNSSFLNAISGNVGIGTSSPNTFKLQVAGNIGPDADSSYDLGTSLVRFNNVFARTISAGTNSLVLSSSGGTVQFATNGSERVRITTSGNVGIGTSTPYSRFTVWGSDTASSTSSFAVVNNASTSVFSVFNGGNAQLSGTLTQSSDRRLKTNIADLDASSSLSLIDMLKPVAFNWINADMGTGLQMGFIAQEVENIFPNLVSTTSATNLTPDGTLGVNYIGVIAPLVKSVQAIEGQVQNLTAAVRNFSLNIVSAHISVTVADIDTANIKNANVQNLCIGSTCINEAQLKDILQKNNESVSSPTPQSDADQAQNTQDSTTTEATSTPVQPQNVSGSDTSTSTPQDSSASSTEAK